MLQSSLSRASHIGECIHKLKVFLKPSKAKRRISFLFNLIISAVIVIGFNPVFAVAQGAKNLQREISLPPVIKKHYIISLEVSNIKKNAKAGLPFLLSLGKEEVKVIVKPISVLQTDAKVYDVTKGKLIKKKIEGNITYSGYVVDAKGKKPDVRLTIGKNVLMGYVRLDREWWFIEPLRKFLPDAAEKEYIVYRTKDLKFKIDLRNDTAKDILRKGFYEEGKGGRSLSSTAPNSNSGRTINSVGIALVADQDLLKWLDEVAIADWRDHPESYLQAMTNLVNGIYEREIGDRFIITCILIDRDNAYLNSDDPDTLLSQLRAFVNSQIGNLHDRIVRNRVEIEVGHLLTGKNLKGNTLGLGENPGNYGLSQQSFETTEGYRFPTSFQNMWIIAHELGHNFNGGHPYADKYCVKDCLVTCCDYVRTLMWEAFYDDNVGEFSDGSRNPDHNNRKRVKDNWETRKIQVDRNGLIPIILDILD